MARLEKEISKLTEQFQKDLSEVIRRQVNEQVNARFAEFRNTILQGFNIGGGDMPQRRLHPLAGVPIEAKPCPVPGCGAPSKARRFSYLCEAHRTPANIVQFRGRKAASVEGSVESGSSTVRAKHGSSRRRHHRSNPAQSTVSAVAPRIRRKGETPTPPPLVQRIIPFAEM